MVAFSRKSLILISSAIWFSIGSLLFARGFFTYRPLLWIIITCIIIGFFKGRFIFAITARRIVKRIQKLEEPVPLYKIYSPTYVITVCSMIALGIMLRKFDLAEDVKAAIDMTIGFAFINGSFAQKSCLK